MFDYNKPCNLPGIIHPTKKALKMFDLKDVNYEYSYLRRIYTFQENSGLIRSGFTSEFFLNYKEYFYIINNY